MTGGPSQIDTFDPKPGHANGGEFKAIETAVPGILISEHLPKLARQMKDIAIIRSMSTKEGDHGRATFNLRTGYQQTGPIRYPTLGLARRQGARARTRPSCRTSSASRRSVRSTRVRSDRASSGRSMPRWSSASALCSTRQGGTDARNLSFKVDDLDLPAGVDNHRADARLGLLDSFRTGLPVEPSRGRPGEPPGCLPAGGSADEVGGGEGVRPRGGARAGPRRLRPDCVRPGLPARPPAGRAGRAVRRGHALLGRRRDAGRLGHAPAELRGGQDSSARCSTRRGRP